MALTVLSNLLQQNKEWGMWSWSIWDKKTLGFRSWDKGVPSSPLRVMCSLLIHMVGRFPQSLPIAGDKMDFECSFQPKLVCDSIQLLNSI